MFFSARLDLGETPCVFVSERLASLRLLLLNLSLSFSLVLIDPDYFTKPVPHFSLLSHPLRLGFNFNGLSCESCMCCFCLLPTYLPADYLHLHPNTDSLFLYFAGKAFFRRNAFKEVSEQAREQRAREHSSEGNTTWA